jgi:hypothetical protein
MLEMMLRPHQLLVQQAQVVIVKYTKVLTCFLLKFQPSLKNFFYKRVC